MRRKKIGTMDFHGSVDITDPCYNRDVWCRMTDVKIRNGVYTCIAWHHKNKGTFDNGEPYCYDVIGIIGIYLDGVIPCQKEMKKIGDIGMLSNIIENHDEPRGVSRFLPDYAQNADGAKMLGTVSVLLRGIPFIYQGQEIGMQNARWNSVDEFDDISTKDQYRVAREAGLSDAEALAVCSVMSRDNARTPMQWKDAPQAGFTSGTPWLKVNDNYPVINVEKEEGQPDSVLHYYRKLIALRKSGEYRELFTYGKFEPAYENADHVMAYYRILQGRRVLVAANFGTDTIELDWEVPAKKVLLSNKKRTNAENKLILEKCEVFVTECK